MTKLFLYVVSASHNPDNVECLVPYPISNKVIFFGPCKTRLRKKLLLTPNAGRHQAFPRDCCFLLNNIFFAQGVGLPVTNKILDVLKKAQRERKDIDEYAIFGCRSDGSADGRTGRWLEITEKNAEELMYLVRASIPATPRMKHTTRQKSKSCSC